MSDNKDDALLASDLLHGAKAIAEFLGIDERACRWQIDNGAIPITRMGRRIVGSKKVLRQRFTPELA
jgi:hypothetical protein